ncbi:hypothetical protein NL676_007818 [Syzygium grande]|nr:hypothetical protein NL676_007818 [Syzygium grande]
MAKELKYARDQPLKWYMWPMAILTDTGLSQERVLVTKPISFIYIIDDIFDVYGTIDDLTSFTDVVNRWECTEKDNIPEYMRMCFHVLDDITNEVSSVVYKNHGWNPLCSLRKTDEFQDGRDGSYVECYKEEFQGASDEVARDHVKKMISEAWKRLNKACLYPHPFTKSFTKASLNTARMVPLMYNYDANHSLPLLEHHMKSLLFGDHSF